MRKEGKPYARPAKEPVEPPHKLRAWRLWRDWSQEIVAEKSGLAVSTISAFETGRDNPSLDSLDKLSRAYGVPRGLLLDVDPNDDAPLWASVLRATKPISPKKS